METKVSDLVQKLFDICDYDPEIELVNPPKGSVDRRCPDITKMRTLDYSPKVNLSLGLKRTFEWYMNNIDRKEDNNIIIKITNVIHVKKVVLHVKTVKNVCHVNQELF